MSHNIDSAYQTNVMSLLNFLTTFGQGAEIFPCDHEKSTF